MLRQMTMMAAYNSWANRRLLDACQALSDSDLRAGLGAFFGSLHGTLNHMLVADRLWLARLRGDPPPDLALDAVLYERFADLRAAREAEDQRLGAHVSAMTPEALEAQITYRTVSKPATITQPVWAALAHMFNHATHHRGQCHAMLTRVATQAPALDLIFFQRETGLGLKSVGDTADAPTRG
ncbi:MAG: DinB family protein [Rubrimonas sp.]|uniref:DinB family protein n=1 Tax=Rubrimonas sp. TaxID=2036015 RepID=UPI002FDCD342